MSRLHRALQRATEGKAQLLPPEALPPEAVSPEAMPAAADPAAERGQQAFTVPWTLDAPAPAAPATEAPRTPRAGSASAETRLSVAVPSETSEKLVTAAATGVQADLVLAIEQYRKLAAILHHAQGDRGLKLIMVTSANPGEGKSLTASNLALTLSVSYQRRVLLVDADLRRPSLHAIFGVPNGRGLSDGLERSSVDHLGVVELSDRLSVLPSGRPMLDPTGALTSAQMRRVLDEARAGYDWAIIDTPPVGMLTDAKLLAEMVDGVVLVVEAEKSPYPDLLRAIDSIGRERVLGAVLNRLPCGQGRAKYYTSYYRHSDAPKG